MFFIQVVLLTWMQIKVLRNVFFWKLDRHPPPRNANNIEPYTFATFFPENVTPPPTPSALRTPALAKWSFFVDCKG